MIRQWALKREDVLLATLTRSDTDWPWVYCTFEPTPAFAEFLPYFQRELELSTEDADNTAWEDAYNSIVDLHLKLIEDDGTVIDTFLLHIDGDTAWFRY